MHKHSCDDGISAFLSVTLCGIDTRFLIDTGATVTILSSKVYNKLPPGSRPALTNTSEKIKVEVADSTLVDVIGVINLIFKTNDTEFQWPVYIAPISDTGLLGMDFLYAHDYNIGAEGLLQLDGVVFKLDIEGVLPQVHRVALTNNVIVPAGTECVVKGSLLTRNETLFGLMISFLHTQMTSGH